VIGEYRYEIRDGGALIAVEESRLDAARLAGVRRTPDGANRHEVAAELDRDGLITRIELRYARGPFARSAIYERSEEILRGTLSGMAARDAVMAKLGRYREIDGDLIICKALIIAHIRGRGQARWTGRVTVIDPATLVASSKKLTFIRLDAEGRRWALETLIGDREELELDAEGRIVKRRDARGTESTLAEFRPLTRPKL
jgi:hypothetical protein